MAKIGLTSGFKLIPEGEYVFKITAVDYKEDFGKLAITLETQDGQKLVERFSLIDKNGEPNDQAYNAFSYFAKTALNDFDLTEIDHEDLVGCFIRAEVTHTTQASKKDPKKTVTFCNLGDKFPADGWEDGEYEEPEEEEETPAPKGKVDLKSLLG